MWTILIVEDEAAIRALIKASLRALDATFFTATSGVEAIKIIKELRPHLVVMDIVLTNTGIDGLEAARMIKRNPQLHTTKILLTSGLIDLRSEEIKDVGVDGVLAKPFEPKRLFRIVSRLLGADKKKAG